MAPPPNLLRGTHVTREHQLGLRVIETNFGHGIFHHLYSEIICGFETVWAGYLKTFRRQIEESRPKTDCKIGPPQFQWTIVIIPVKWKLWYSIYPLVIQFNIAMEYQFSSLKILSKLAISRSYVNSVVNWPDGSSFSVSDKPISPLWALADCPFFPLW